ncbi:TolC family protein [Pendulispora brunnea]|uniref:TolC family protein n=1 Tax=Pendulispora brunnea TaxID=2905690 RepID=A0ABZ2K9L3_9BACT
MFGLFASTLLLATLTLEDARGLARQNIDVRVAALQVQQAREQQRIARAAVLPQVAVRAEFGAIWTGPQRYTSTFPSGPAGEAYERQSVEVPAYEQAVYSLGLGISQLLYDGGRFWNEIARTRTLVEAEKGRLAEQELAVTLETDRLYFEVWRATRVRESLDRAIEHSAEQKKRAEVQLAYGRAQRRDVIDAELNHANDQLARARQEARVTHGRSALAAWLLLDHDGFAIGALAPLGPLAPAEPADALPRWLARARAKRPLLTALIREREAAERQIATARAAWFPRVTAELGYQRQGATFSPFFTDPSKQNAFQGSIVATWNIFDGFATSAAVASAKLRVEQVKLEARRAEVQIEAEIRQAVATHAASWNAYVIAERSRGLAGLDLRLAEERFEAGTGSTLEIRDAQVKWLQAELSAIDAEAEVRLSRSTLTRVVGGP